MYFNVSVTQSERRMALYVGFAAVVLLFCNPVWAISGAFYADNGREQTVLFKTLGKKDKIELQEEILNLLGLEHRPRKGLFNKRQKFDNHTSSAEKYLLDIYKTLEQEEGNTNISINKIHEGLLSDSDFIVSFANKIHHQYPHLRHESDRRFYFDVRKIPPEEELVKAELRIFRNVTKKNHLSKKYKYFLYLYAVSEDNNNANTLELVDELVVHGTDSEGWLVFNVTSSVMNWIAFPRKNLGLYLKIKSLSEFQDKEHRVDPHEIGILSSRAPDEYKAFMVAYFKTPSHMRIRTARATRKKQDSYYDRNDYSPYSMHKDKYISKSRSCERWTLYVSFRDLGFEDWIIAPDGYAAFYCDGSCTFPLNAHSNATNHAIVQTLMHLMDPASVPKPSCAPTQLTAITVLYFDDNSDVILKKYKNMVVKSCGCH